MMSEMEWGSDEHLDGLGRDALKSEVRWWHGRALEMEAENAKLLKELEAEHALAETLGHYHEHAQAENAKLREDVDRLIQAVEDLHDVSLEDRLLQMENENDRLRELVGDMWLELDALVPYDPYDHDGLDEYRDRMRELGVDDGVLRTE